MNESFQRITAWAKSHPALAVGIVAVLVLVGYLAYKKVGGGLVGTDGSGDTSGLTTGGGGGGEEETPLPGYTDPYYFAPATTPDSVTYALPTWEYAQAPLAFASAYPSFTTPSFTTGSNVPQAADTIGEVTTKERKVVTSADLGAQKAALTKQVTLSGLASSLKMSAFGGAVIAQPKTIKAAPAPVIKTPLTPTVKTPLTPTVKTPLTPTVKTVKATSSLR